MKSSKGFSLFEVVVYMAIVSVLLVTILTIVVESMLTRTKAEAMQNVTYETQFVLDRMTTDIRAAVDINETDLSKNILTVTLADGSIHRYENKAGQITVRFNTQTPVALTSAAVTAPHFILSNRTTVGTQAKDIGIVVSLQSVTANPRPQFMASQTLTTTVSTRL